jgi:(R,R)-butanediol dehydrogenase / meso-butanediol dehydrogenase / diacetyl reductase
MKQVRVHGQKDWRLDDIPSPSPADCDALVRIAACGICGSDVSYIHMGGLTKEPMALGHEMAGVVEWIGCEVTDVVVGDRVIVCPSDVGDGSIGNGGEVGGLTPLLLVRDVTKARRLFSVPDGMPLTTAALAEPLAVGMQSVNQAEVHAGDKIAVFGCGPIGLMAIATLADRGIDDVVAIDFSDVRLDLAKKTGARHTLNPSDGDVWKSLKELHGTASFAFGPTASTNVFIEASGSDEVISQILTNGPVGGRLVVVALHYRPVRTNYVELVMKQFTIRGSIEYPERFEDAIDLLGRRDLSGLITHSFRLEEFGEALAALEGSSECGKVMITIEEVG